MKTPKNSSKNLLQVSKIVVSSGIPTNEGEDIYKNYNMTKMTNKVKKVKMSKKQQLENIWFDAYDLLSNAGFDILIDENGDNSMTVFHRDYQMVFGKNGMTLKKDNK